VIYFEVVYQHLLSGVIRNEKPEECAMAQALTGRSLTAEVRFNLLKPSGNFTYHQV
jgi:hypothetical protein